MARTKEFDIDQTLENAMELFWEKGFHATSMQDLVSVLGVNRGSLYDTFGNKRDLYLKTLEKYKRQNQEWLDSFLADQPSVKEGLQNFISHLYASIQEDTCQKGCYLVNSTTELASLDSEIKSFLLENKQQFISKLASFISSGIEKNEIRLDANPESIASTLFVSMNGLRVLSKLENDQKSLNSIKESIMALL